MKESAIITNKTYNPSDIICEFTDTTTHKMDMELMNTVDNRWCDTVNNAINNGKTCYNGWSYRVENIEERGNKLYVKLSIIEFKKRLILQRMLLNNEDMPDYSTPNAVSTGGIVKTNDGYYVLVRLSNSTMNNNTYEVPGGMCENTWDNEVITTNQKLEVHEEIGVLERDYKVFTLLGVIKKKATEYNFVYYHELHISKNELLEQYKSVTDTDITGIECFLEDDYKRVMKAINKSKEQYIELLDAYQNTYKIT